MEMRSAVPKLVSAIVAAVVLLGVPQSANAYEAVSGEYWTYSLTMYCQGHEVEGQYTVTFEGQEAVELGGLAQDVNVFSVSGTFFGEDELLSIPVSAEGGLRGTILEPVKGFGVLRDDTTTWCNLTYDFGSEETTVRTETQMTYTASPAWFNGFLPGETSPSDYWTENITEATTFIEREQGIELVRETNTEMVSYSFVVSSIEHVVTTPAGEFLTTKITVLCEDESTDSYWWADEVDRFVMEEHYGPDETEPYSRSELVEFENKVPVTAALFVTVGVAALVFAIAILFFVIVRARRPAPPAQPPAESPPQGSPPSPPSR